MGCAAKAQELRALLGLAIKLRTLAETTDDLSDTELFLSSAVALENRANHLAFGTPDTRIPVYEKIDMIC